MLFPILFFFFNNFIGLFVCGFEKGLSFLAFFDFVAIGEYTNSGEVTLFLFCIFVPVKGSVVKHRIKTMLWLFLIAGETIGVSKVTMIVLFEQIAFTQMVPLHLI
mgnify:FL=1